MSRRCLVRILALLVVLPWLPSRALAEGKIQHAREEAKGHDHGQRSGSHHDDDDDDDNILSAILCALFSSDDSGSSYSSSGDGESSEPSLPSPTYRYAPYPYAHGHHGYLVPNDYELAYNSDVVRPLGRDLRDYALQLSLEGGYLSGIARADTSIRLLTPVRIELETRFAYLHEDLAHVMPGEPDTDSTTLGSTHLAYRLFQGEAGMLRIGVGPRYMIDAKGAQGGVDVLLGFDLFVGRPIVLSLELDTGSLGAAVVFAPRVQLGVMLDRVELFVSYEHLMIGDAEMPTPMLGSRMWF
jgi:hypothetical protein